MSTKTSVTGKDDVERIGRYEIEGTAGRGAMGIVYKAFDPFIERNVAIKVRIAGKHDEVDEDDARARKMFLNEAKAAGQLDHPNILRIYDVGEFDNRPYIVMEFVNGVRSLQQNIRRKHRLDQDTVVEYFRQCALALDYAHERKVLHRDVKPANIMLTEREEVKLCDFGIAQRMTVDATQTTSVFGSPVYMPPEQIDGDALGPAADIYSLGVSMYELLCGRPPFYAESIPMLVVKIVSDDPTPFEEHDAKVPKELADIVFKAIARKPEDRYERAADFAAALAAYSAGETLSETRVIPQANRLEITRHLKFFGGFADEELQEILEMADWQAFRAGDHCMNEGDVSTSFGIVALGEVDVIVGDTTIATLGAGEAVGEISYLNRVPRFATVVARTGVNMLFIEDPPSEWASIPCQMRLQKAFQRALIERLVDASRRIARARA